MQTTCHLNKSLTVFSIIQYLQANTCDESLHRVTSYYALDMMTYNVANSNE